MNKRDSLISLKKFSEPEFEKEFLNNSSLERIFLNICQTHIDYASNIMNDNPYEALEIYMDLNDFHDILGSMPHDIIDLSVNIAVKIAENDILKAFEIIETIDIDDFKIEAYNKILEKMNDKSIIKMLNEKISLFNDCEIIL